MIELACSQFWSCLHMDYWLFLLLLPDRHPFYVTIDSWDRDDVCVWVPSSARQRGKSHMWLRWKDYGSRWLMALPPLHSPDHWDFLHQTEPVSLLAYRVTSFPKFYDYWYAGMHQSPNVAREFRPLYLSLYVKGDHP